MADVHDDPLREGANAIVGLASEFSNVIMATQSLQLRLIGLKPDKDAPLEDALEEAAEEIANPHLRAQQQANARFAWQPALNDEWLGDATPVEAARAWAAAVPFAKDEPSAALAVARTEVRLNELHPEAMAEYRQLRSEGWAPTDAMLECAELFDRQSSTSAEATSSSGPTSSRTSNRTALTQDLGMEQSAHMGPENPIALNLPPGQHSPSAGAAYDEALGASATGAPKSFLDDEAADAGADMEDALVAPAPAGGATENVLQESAGLHADRGAEAPSADRPDLTPPGTGDNLSPTEIAMQVFPDAHEAAQRTAQLAPTNQPQKRKVLSKVLKRGGRR